MRKLLAAVIALAIAPAAFAEDAPAGTPPPAAPAPAAPAADAPAATASAPAAANEAPKSNTSTTVNLVANSAAVQRPGGFHLGLSVDHSMGYGTLIQSYYGFVAGSLVVAPSYSFEVMDVKLAASANGSFSYEYTPPDNPTGRHYDWGDIGVGISAPALYKEKVTGISISPRVGFTLPISLASHFRGTISNLSAGVSAGRGFGKFNVGASIGASKTLYASTTRNISPEEAAAYRQREDLPVFICRTDSANCGLAGVPAAWALSGGVNASYSATEKLVVGAAFNLSKAWKYAMPVDEFTTHAFYSDGTPVGQAQGSMDNMVGSLFVGYQLTDVISVSGGMATVQPPLSSDGKRVRFPFFAFEGKEDSHTSFSLSLSAQF